MDIPARNRDETARKFAYRVILKNIIDLVLPPGSTVSENELSESLSVSRTPVREALIDLSRMSLVDIIPKKGTFVTRIDYDLVEDSQFVRLSLEIAVLKLVCSEGLSKEYAKLLHDNLEQESYYVDNPDPENEIQELDNEFHRLLFESVGKIHSYEFLQLEMVHFDRLRTLAYRTLGAEKAATTVNDHENILYAIEKRDAELAEMLMTKHLSRHHFEKEELDKEYPDYFV